MVFSPNTFRGAPIPHIATLTYPGGSTSDAGGRAAQGGGRAFPAVTAMRVRDALDAVGGIR